MIKKLSILLMIGMSIVSCNNQRKNKNMETKEQHTAIFPKGTSGSSDWFTGTVYVQGLVNPEEIEGLYSVGQVTFEPGGKTNWHTHPIGQVLLVTEGRGFYQERGKPARELAKGSVVVIPKDVEHWHGASADTKLVHIAISNVQNGSAVTWMSPVNDKEYAEVNQ
ncbi:MAG: cupin domain-containing protein [Bacteroidales bacterium]|jgi:4-carboxymuconolactone decarboxylase|nr:cupin domain-containing protein [Bacteroidales bacterium]